MSQTRRLHVVVLTSWMRFPHGMAATNRALLLARALVGAGADVRFLIMQASERPPVVENREVRGVHEGVRFEYTTGTTRRNSSFVMRRLIELRGWMVGVARLWSLRSAGELDVVYLWLTSQRLNLSRVAFMAVLRLLRVPVVIELNERPWSLRSDIRAVEKRWSPLDGTAGAVSISAFLSSWARREAEALRGPFQLLEVPIIVDMDEARPDSYPEDPPTVVFAGAPQYDDTLRFVFDAMREVWLGFPECRLVVTGSNPADPAAQWLMRAASEGALDERVLVAGYLSRADLLVQYSRAHALLIPLFDDVRSRARFPTKIGEYLASGRPIVTTSVGEMPRFFEDHASAFMCRPGDVRAYGAKVCEALADADRAARVGAAGREVARRFFHYELYGGVLCDGFTKAATLRRPR
jgi:glycosyltransferase involved in cell wall biosynthesis